MINTQQFHQRYANLWASAPNLPTFVKERGFDYLCFNKTGSLLFVGINPSYKPDVSETAPSKPTNNGKKSTHPYFTAIKKVSINCGFNGEFEALDILAIRTPYLNDIKDEIQKNTCFKDFCIEQFKIFKDILRLAKPCAIIVCNAYAREWMSNKNFNNEAFELSCFDEKIGTKRIINDEALENVPVFFCGMFSGKHIMDSGSRERLEWQIKRAKTNNLLKV